ncbi:MAG: hypothetical protein SGARI_007122 [Bacillariaceae sp.]
MLFERHGERERGMLHRKPSFVVEKFCAEMQRIAPSMTLPSLCSLRRHHIKLFCGNDMTMTQCGLGNVSDINKSARLFELAISKFLKSQGIQFRTEKQLKKEQQKVHGRVVATPDFSFATPVELKMGNSTTTKTSISTTSIHWMEVKMYYGASTIPAGSAGAVSTLMATAQKYVTMFGNGAMVFMQGCGDSLAKDLLNQGPLSRA